VEEKVTMKLKIPRFEPAELEAVARALDDAATGSKLTRLFEETGLKEPPESGQGMTKWKRIYNALTAIQNNTDTGNFVMKLIRVALAPARFLTRATDFDRLRCAINEILVFRGFHFRADGQFERTEPATTIDAAKERADRLRAELQRRGVHQDVLAFCQAELVQRNYFHAVLEATKSVAEKLRQKSGLTNDGGELATAALSLGQTGIPYLAFNELQTDTHKSEQKGLMNLFVGMFGTFRNVTAHGPKLAWEITEQDALDLLTLVSLLHRRLDTAVVTGKTGP